VGSLCANCRNSSANDNGDIDRSADCKSVLLPVRYMDNFYCTALASTREVTGQARPGVSRNWAR
jgi:hypothetical protein